MSLTNKEAVLEVAQISASDTAIEKAFLDAKDDYNLTPSGNYVSANEEGIDWIAVSLLSNFLNADVKEGEYSVSYKDSIEKKISRLKAKWGFDEVEQPGIKDASFLW